MKEHPIIFNVETAKAIFDGRKTQTRRPIKEVPYGNHYGKDIMDWPLSGVYKNVDGSFSLDVQTAADDNSHQEIKCPYGQPGDRLWVRETWWCDDVSKAQDVMSPGESLYYKASEENPEIFPKWKPSIHMPRWASRITLEITDVRVERVQEILDCAAKMEGISITDFQKYQRENGVAFWNCYRDKFKKLWNSIYAKKGYGWDVNPWVWAIEFKMIKPLQQRRSEKMFEKLEEIKKMGAYEVYLCFGEGMGCDDISVGMNERVVKVFFVPVGCLGETKVMWVGKVKNFNTFNFKNTPKQISNPPNSEECKIDGYYIWGTDRSVESVLRKRFSG